MKLLSVFAEFLRAGTDVAELVVKNQKGRAITAAALLGDYRGAIRMALTPSGVGAECEMCGCVHASGSEKCVIVTSGSCGEL